MTPHLEDSDFTLYIGDALDVLRELPAESVHCVVTSPPYWGLRDYGATGQLGLEATPELYVARMVEVFRQVRRVLRSDGTLWLNIGDSYNNYDGGSYANDSREPGQHGSFHLSRRSREIAEQREPRPLSAGLKRKDLVGIPWRLAFALQTDGWYLRSDIIWSKPNPMPESVTDRPTKAHEYLFLLTKSPKYFYDQDAIREPYKYDGRTVTHVEGGSGSAQHRNGERWPGMKPRSSGNLERKPNPAAVLGQGDTKHGIPWTEGDAGRNRRSVWEVATEPYPDAHFATYPQALIEPCIKAGCPEAVCATCGRPLTADVILTPLGSGPSTDPTMHTGRKGMNRPRRADEGVRAITRAEQHAYAQQLRDSPHRVQMEAEAGDAFAHYIRVDDSGARPVPPALLNAWTDRGWLTAAEASTACCDGRTTAGVVLDPFLGSGTTALVARRHGRRSIGIELSPEYARLAAQRLSQLSLLAEIQA